MSLPTEDPDGLPARAVSRRRFGHELTDREGSSPAPRSSGRVLVRHCDVVAPEIVVAARSPEEDGAMREIRGSLMGSQLETAWRIHASHVRWVESVDNKAGFAFAVQSATVTVALFLASSGPPSATATSFGRAAIALGVVAIMAGAALSALVVTPQLRAGSLREESRSDFIYFGHSRLWTAEALQRRLRREDPIPQLSRQIVILAEIAWVKHRRVRTSIMISVAGGGWLVSYAMFVILR